MLTKKIAAVFTAAMVVVVTALRIAFPPQLKANGQSSVSYVIIGAVACILIVLFFLFGRNGGEKKLDRRSLLPPACFGVLFGFTLLLSTLYDIYVFLYQNHKTPPPGEMLTGAIDGFLLFLIFVFGVIGGIFMITMALRWIKGQEYHSRGMAYMSLMPVLWMWMRLARYDLSYASAVDISKSFYDFVMFIFTLLFLLGFARYVAGVGSQKRLTFIAAGAALFGLSGPATHFIFQLIGNSKGFENTYLATVTDFTLGLFALSVVFVLAFSKEQPEEQEEPEAEALPVEDAPVSDIPIEE